jgi:hypothetical protein
MDGLARQLSNVIKAGEQTIETSVNLTKEDLHRNLIDLRKSRRRLATLIHDLERELRSYDQ